MEYIANVGVYDYEGNKLCDLFDSQVNLIGQAFGIEHIENGDGVGTLTFSIPYMVDKKLNFRWNYLRNEYLIRLHYNGKDEWFVANKPIKKKTGKEIIGNVSCNGTPILLKTKNIHLEFDDENGIGTIDYLMNQILAGTGWTLGYCEVLYEEDGVTEKVRSLNSSGSKGALGLINDACNLFMCRPVYHTDTNVVDILSIKNRDMIFEAEVGKNLDSLSATYNSDDIITRLYVEGEYGDHGYVGIDDVNPTGLSYLFNFDYYREIGVFSERHEAALATYLSQIQNVVSRLKSNQGLINEQEGVMNNLVGQCKLTVYYASEGFITPTYVYGDPTAEQKQLAIGDEVVVMNNDGTFRYDTIVSTPQELIHSGDYAIAKFGTKASGSVGAKEVQIEAKEKEIGNLNRKINATTKEDKKAEYRSEIATLQSEIDKIYAGDENTDGLYKQMSDIMKSDGTLYQIKFLMSARSTLLYEQDNIEATFIAAMGNLLRDGKWQNNNYIVGQEEHLLADANERMRILSRPQADYSFDYIRMHQKFGVPIEDIKINAIVRVNDEELDVHENMYVSRKITGIDKREYGKIEVSTDDLSLSSNDLSNLLSRMSQLADLIDQKNTIYNRAEAISRSGTFYADRLNGMIDVVKNQILSTVSNWYTDDSGNLVFESIDGGSIMMISGAGLMIADSKNEDGSWNWRSTLTGHGLNADEIVAGFLSADRIEAGSIEVGKVAPTFGSELVITGNPIIEEHDTAIRLMPGEIISEVVNFHYSRTYVQHTDPALDPENEVREGDYWIYSDTDGSAGPKLWQDIAEKKWEDLAIMTWGVLQEYERMYVRRNDDWLLVYDKAFEPYVYTRFDQTDESIRLEAVRAVSEEEKLSAKIQLTADEIDAEVGRATAAEGQIVAKLQLTADGKISLTSTNFSHIGQTSSGIYITPTSVDINSSGTLAIKSGGNMNVNSGGNMNINSGGAMTVNSGGAMTIASGGNMNINSGSSMTIKSGGNLTINSGGNFSLTSTYFNVATNGQITCTGGTIGGFTISSNKLSAGSGSSYVQVATSTWAFAAGNNDVSNAPFRVAPNGDVYIKSLKVRNEANTGWDTIDFTSFATQEEVAGGFDKLKYNTVKSIASDGKTMTLSNGRTYSIG